MGQVLVRNLEDRVLESLRIKAELNGNSLEAQLRLILTQAAGLTGPEKVALARRMQSLSPAQMTDSTDLIREDRDRDWR